MVNQVLTQGASREVDPEARSSVAKKRIKAPEPIRRTGNPPLPCPRPLSDRRARQHIRYGLRPSRRSRANSADPRGFTPPQP